MKFSELLKKGRKTGRERKEGGRKERKRTSAQFRSKAGEFCAEHGRVTDGMDRPAREQ